jgi:hypothetical protein
MPRRARLDLTPLTQVRHPISISVGRHRNLSNGTKTIQTKKRVNESTLGRPNSGVRWRKTANTRATFHLYVCTLHG